MDVGSKDLILADATGSLFINQYRQVFKTGTVDVAFKNTAVGRHSYTALDWTARASHQPRKWEACSVYRSPALWQYAFGQGTNRIRLPE